MGRLYFVGEKEEIDRRKKLLGQAVVVEVWQDLYTPDIVWIGDDETRRISYSKKQPGAPTGLFWMGEEAKRTLDRAGDELRCLLAIDAAAVPVYYGPRLADLESLPSEESLKARVLSAHGIAVVWATYDRFGERHEYRPMSPIDPTFYLRRARGSVVHLWRLFRTKSEAIAYMTEHFPEDPEALGWADRLAVEDFEQLMDRFGRRGSL